jgi:hypothetical protein
MTSNPPSDGGGQPPREPAFDPSEQTPGTRPPSPPPGGGYPQAPPPANYPPPQGDTPGSGYPQTPPPGPGYPPQQPAPGYPPPPGYPPQGYPPQPGYPPQGYPPPPGYGQQPPVPSSSWSAPTSSGSTPMSGQGYSGGAGAVPASAGSRAVDLKSINPLDWAILACGFLAFIFSFFSYYTASVKGVLRISGSFGAWHGFFGWFAALIALLSAGVLALALFAPELKIPVAIRVIVLGGFAIATLCVLLAWIITPSSTGGGIAGISTGRGAGFYLSLIVIVAGLVLSFLRLRGTGGKLPWEAK